MKTEDKTNLPRVRIAVLGKINVGKSGKYIHFNQVLLKVSSKF